MGTSATAAKNRYNKKNYDHYLLTMKKNDKDRYRTIAESKGLSLNAFIIQAIDEKIEREQ